MSTIKNIQKQKEQIKKLEQEIEEVKKNIDSTFGETMIKELGIDYDDLSSKKEIKEVVKKIKERLPESISKNLKEEDKNINQESTNTSDRLSQYSSMDSNNTL